ncbi:MAG: hypothetical protein GXP29_14510, partial [Planctomycetes bacterium]|nr:hypothetical protein [Planctomycetota bacterium]
SLWEGEAWAFDPRGRSDRKTNAATDQILLRVNAERKTLLDGLSELTDLQGEQTGAAQSGAVWSDRIRALLAAKDVHEKIEQWAVAADENGAVALAAEHRQVWISIDGFLGDLALSLGDQVLTLPELRAIVDAGLSQLTLGLVPPTVDQLLVGSIERSRHPELKAVILLGFNEGVFPRTAVEDAVLNDDDRDALNSAGLRVGVTRRQTVFDEQLLVYVALTRPAQKLLITYAGSDADGKSLQPSAYLASLKALLPGLEVTAYGNAVQDRAMWSLTTVEDLAGALTCEMRHRPNIDADDGDVRARWNDLYLLARGSYGEDHRLALALSALAYENVAALSAESIERIPGSKWIASVSELETFAACPFKRFAGYGLRLRERPEASLQATDLGTVQHAILEDFINRSMHQGDTFADIDENEVMHRLQTIAGNLANDWTELAGHTTARDAYLLERSSRDLS